MSNLIWLNTKVKILINRVNVLAEVHSLLNSNILYKHVPQHVKLHNHNYCLWTDIDKILPTKLKFLFLFKWKK